MSFARAIAATDYLRWSAGNGDREWLHFVVHAPDIDLVVNFSLVDLDTGPRAQVLVLVRERAGGQWQGDIEAFELSPGQVGTGRIRLALGRASLDFDGRFRVAVEQRRRPLSLALELEPCSFPYLVHNADGGALHWLVAPRLLATGTVRWNGRATHFSAAPTYHDHNWGRVRGDGQAWEWCCALGDGDDPWSVVMVRLLDRARAGVLQQGLLLWRGAHRQRAFRGAEVAFRAHGLLRPPRPLCVPRALSLLAPGSATDVPERLQVSAAAAGARLEGELRCQDVARVVVPRDDDLGTTLIHEVAGRLELRGRLDGQAVAIDAPAVAEFLGEAS